MTLHCTPMMLSEKDAAAYLGVSVGTLRNAKLARKEWNARRLYMRDDLDDFARALPYEGQEGGDQCDETDRLFGLK